MWYSPLRSLLGYARPGISVRYSGSQGDATNRILQAVSSMPRERQHVPAAQRQRQHIADKSDKFGASSVYLQVLGSGNPNSLYLFTDQKRYLFNCGEGTQRLAHEHKVKLSRLEHVLVTSKTWRHMGGLPGVSLTLQDVGVPKITLHGPPGLDELYKATRRFVIMNNMEVAVANCSPTQDFEDNIMSIKYVLIGPDDDVITSVATKRPKGHQEVKTTSEFEDDDIDYYRPPVETKRPQSPRTKSPERRRSPERPGDAKKLKNEQVLSTLQRKSVCSVSYICTLKKRLGTLDLAKCVDRGVKPGPLLGLLKQGKDVLLDDGRLVLSAEVKTPDELGPVFIVLDVPDVAYLKESEFREHFDDGFNPPEQIPAVIAHFTPKHITDDQRYKDFVRRFGPTTRHLLLNKDDCSGSVAVHRAQHKLHLLDAEIFPLLKDSTVPALWKGRDREQNDVVRNKIALAQFESIFNNSVKKQTLEIPNEEEEYEDADVKQPKLEFSEASTLTMFQLRPKKLLDRTSELKLNIEEYIAETMDVEGFAASLEQFHHTVQSLRSTQMAPPKMFPRILFLGTGSCIPNKTRNTSAILIHIDESRCILLDCGEGTYGQLVRFFGPKQVRNVLASLRAVYVSHLHADHHIGLIGVLQGRRRALNELREERLGSDSLDSPLYLLAPGQIMTWLNIYDQQFERIRQEFQIIPNQTLLPNPQPYLGETMTSAVLANIGLRSIGTCQVQHCPNSFGVSMEVQSGEKITYSGDTMPCDELVTLGEDSTLLIHEATMEDELADEARIKKHSTTSQAIDIGRRMRAKHTLLTHFSQRYARLPRLGDDFMKNNESVGIAFDNMQVTMDDLELLPYMYAPLQLMFAEHCQELEQRAVRRAQKREMRSRSPSPAEKSPFPMKKHSKGQNEGSRDIAVVSERISNLNSSDR